MAGGGLAVARGPLVVGGVLEVEVHGVHVPRLHLRCSLRAYQLLFGQPLEGPGGVAEVGAGTRAGPAMRCTVRGPFLPLAWEFPLGCKTGHRTGDRYA